jgi:hypothetical protein
MSKTKCRRMAHRIGMSLSLGLLVSSATAGIDEVRFFESNSLDGLRVSGNSPTVQSSIKRGGRYAMKSHLSSSGRNNFRTEVRLIAPDSQLKKEYWYGFSVYLPSDYKADKVWEIVAQWKNWPDSGDTEHSPPLTLSTTGGVWSVTDKWNANRTTTPSSTRTSKHLFGPYTTGKWTDWVFRIRWAYDKDGLLEIWKDGKKVLSKSGPNTYNDARMPYFKFGIYKGWHKIAATSVKTRTLYHDQLRFVGPGGAYSYVAPTSNSTVSRAYDVAAY